MEVAARLDNGATVVVSCNPAADILAVHVAAETMQAGGDMPKTPIASLPLLAAGPAAPCARPG